MILSFIKCTSYRVSLSPFFQFFWGDYGDVVYGYWINSTSLSEYAKLCCDCINEFFWSNTSENISQYYLYHFLKDHVHGVNKKKWHSKSAISVFSDIVGYVNRFQRRGFWWYQVSIVNFSLYYLYGDRN